MADGVWEGCNIKTKALRHEVMYCPSPEGYDYLNDGYHMSDGDIGCYERPEVGNMFLIGSEDPECDPQEWVDPDEFYAGKGGPGRDNVLTDAQWKAQCYRLGKRIPSLTVPNQPKGWWTCMMCPMTGFPSMTNPICPVSTWPSALPATSTRTPRWWAA